MMLEIGGHRFDEATVRAALDQVKREQQDPEILRAAEACAVIADRIEKDSGWAEPLDGWDPREKFMDARQPLLITKELIRTLPRFDHIRGRSVGVLYTETSFTVGGRAAIGKCQKPSGLLRKYSQRDWIFVYSWWHWMELTPLQRVALVFHELMHAVIDHEKDKPAVRPHDFEGFFVELEVFGTDLFRDWRMLGESVERAPQAGQVQLDLDDVVDETEREPVGAEA